MTLAHETRTAPGEQFSVDKTMPAEGIAASPTVCTTVASFEQVRTLLTDRPLRRPPRTLPIDRLEDLEDLQAFRDRQDEPGIPWEQIRRDLGL